MFDTKVYSSRRKVLAGKVGDGIVLLLGNGEAECNYADNAYLFRQDSTFLYYFGLDKPSLAGVIDTATGEEVIFGDDVDMDDIIWMGPQPRIAEEAATVGVGATAPLSALAGYLKEASLKGRRIHFIPQYRSHNRIMLHRLLGMGLDEVDASSSDALVMAVISQRLIKEKCEIDEIDKACNLGYAMHYTAMKLMREGMVEQELVGAMEGVCISGGYMTSFPTILSQHGETLHNHRHDGVLSAGKLCVIDAGAEIASHYASDFTRTWPVGGRFTTRQKEIYTIVSTANQYALETARPGITYKDVHLGASRIILQGLSNLGLVKGDMEEMIAAGVQGLFMPHGLGHNMGLDVHDMENLGELWVGYNGEPKSTLFGLKSLRLARPLEPGFVFTIEPGIYFIPELIDRWRAEGRFTQFLCYDAIDRWRHFGGLRNEENYLITPTGARLLGHKRKPMSIDEIYAVRQG